LQVEQRVTGSVSYPLGQVLESKLLQLRQSLQLQVGQPVLGSFLKPLIQFAEQKGTGQGIQEHF
jgi:hypothetical protein